MTLFHFRHLSQLLLSSPLNFTFLPWSTVVLLALSVRLVDAVRSCACADADPSNTSSIVTAVVRARRAFTIGSFGVFGRVRYVGAAGQDPTTLVLRLLLMQRRSPARTLG